jgi:hypothetical protein
VNIENAGKSRAPETKVFARDPDRRWSSPMMPVRALGPGESQQVEIRLGIPDNQRDTTHTFLVEVDPDGQIRESNEGNNTANTPEIPIPPKSGYGLWQLIEPIIELPWRFIIPVAVTGTFALVAIVITMNSIIKARRRKKWQKEAKEEEPPKKCKPCTYYCQKIELELEPHLRKITKLLLTAYDSVSGEQSKDKQVKGKIVDNLNKKIRVFRLKKDPKKLHKQMVPLSKTFLKQAIKWLQGESAARDVSIVAHLEGSQISCEFILYHCERKGSTTAWKEVDRWKKSMKDELDISIGTLCGLDPTDPAKEGKLVPEFTEMLIQFIEKV